ncbi:MAG: alpha/beta fold hydrolase [Gemmatimonadota bacterium]
MHGFPRNGYLWRDCLRPAAAAGFRSLAPDLLGLGESTGPQASDFSAAAQADLLIALLERTGVVDVRLVGEGFGARVVMALALRGPARVRAVVLADPPPAAGFTAGRLAGALARGGHGDLVLEILRGGRALARLDLAPGREGRGPLLDRELWLRPLLASPESRARAAALLAATGEPDTAGLEERFAREGDVPTLVCSRGRAAGEAPRSLRPLARLRRAHEVPLRDSAARLLERDPSAFLDLVLPFLAAVEARG